MKTIIAVAVMALMLCPPAFAKAKPVAVPASSTQHSIGKSIDKVQAEAVDAITDNLLGEDTKTVKKTTTTSTKGVPPGLAKKDKMPPGLAKKGKTPPGWEKSKTEVEVEPKKEESLVRRFINKLFNKDKVEDTTAAK